MERIAAFRKFEKMKWLIEHCATGSPKEFASKMEVSERTLFRLIREVQDLYKIHIRFSYQLNSYTVVK